MQLIALTVAQRRRRPTCCPARRRSTASRFGPPCGSNRTRMPATHRPRPTSPAIGRMKRDQSGTFSRERRPSILLRGNSSGARHPSVSAPRSSSDAHWLGQLSSMAFRTASVSVPPLLTHSTDLGPEGAGADGAGHEVGSVEADAGCAVRDLGRDLQLVGAGIPVGRGGGVGRDGAAGEDPVSGGPAAWQGTRQRRGPRAGRRAPSSCRPSPRRCSGPGRWSGTGRCRRQCRRCTWTAARWPADPGRSPARTRSGSSASSTAGAARSVVEHRVHGRLLVRGDDRGVAAEDVVRREEDLADVVVEGGLDARVLERDLVVDPLVVVVEALGLEDDFLDPVGDLPAGRVAGTARADAPRVAAVGRRSGRTARSARPTSWGPCSPWPRRP